MSNSTPFGSPPGSPQDPAASPPDGRLHAPAALRNRAPIAAVLADWLPAGGTVLELASGTGEHGLHFAACFPGLVWQPSDPEPQNRRSIEAYRRAEGTANLRPPLDIDVTAHDWPLEDLPGVSVDALVCCNMIHIAPWAAAEGLFAGAGRYLKAGGGVFLYGPFRRRGVPTAPSNEAFDASLKSRNPAWGLRDLAAVTALAQAAGLAPPQVVEMPANNLSLWFVKQA